MPEAIPVRIPVAEPIDAGMVLLRDHVPPVGVALRAEDWPTQTTVPPEMAEGSGLMVITALPVMRLVQPVVALVATTV